MDDNLSSGSSGPRPSQLVKTEYARRLKKHLDRKNMRQSDLARLADLNRDVISTACRARSLPDPVNRAKIARALGVAPEELLPNDMQGDTNMAEPPYSLRAYGTDGKLAWLTVNRLVEAKTGSAVIALLNEDKASPE